MITDSIQNYYEPMVIETMDRELGLQNHSADYLSDVACVALNNMPPRYFRFEVDMAFYLSPAERKEMEEKVNMAVKDAIKYVNAHQNRAAETN